MKYKVLGIMQFQVEMIIDAESGDKAEELAMDRMDDGSFDGYRLVEPIGDNEVSDVSPVN